MGYITNPDFIHNVIQNTAKLCVSSIRHRCVEKTHGVLFDFANSVAFSAAYMQTSKTSI